MPHLLFALSMEVDAFNAASDLVEADVIEALEACAAYGPDAVVGHEEILFPAHKKMLFLHPVFARQFGTRQVLGQRLVGREARPVLAIDLFVGAPFGMLGNEGVLASDDLSLEVGRQAWMILGQAW